MGRLSYTIDMDTRNLSKVYFALVLIASLILVFFILKPFLSVLVVSASLAFLTIGLTDRATRLLKSRTLASLGMTFAVFVCILLPFTLIGARIVTEAGNLYQFAQSQSSRDSLDAVLTWAQSSLQHVIPGATLNSGQLMSHAEQMLTWLIGRLGVLLGSFATLLINFLLLLLCYFYMVRDGRLLLARFIELSPLPDAHEEQVLERIGHTVVASVRGALLLGIMQGLFTGIGFAIFHVPNPALWGCFAFLASFIPSIGTALIQIPAVLYVAATGNLSSAIGLSLWAAVAVGMIDNVMGPKMMSHGARMHPLIMMFAVLGGVAFFGPIGILLGPIAMSLLTALLSMHQASTAADASEEKE